MDPSRLHDAVAARVVAWHNRHPLARRIGAGQVHSVGYVVLPFAVPGMPAQPAPVEAGAGASLRERALARSRQGGAAPLPAAPPRAAPAAGVPAAAQPAFDEDFIPPLTPRQVARWARRHAQPLGAVSPTGMPLREVAPAQPLPAGMQALPLLVLTAAIEVGGARRRVLLGSGDSAAVLGRRLASRGRGGLAALLLVAVMALPAALLMRQRAPADEPGPVAAVTMAVMPVAAAASMAPSLADPPSVTDAPVGAQAGGAAASASPLESPSTAVPAVAGAASAPAPVRVAVAPAVAASAAGAGTAEPAPSPAVIDVEPRLGRIELPPLDLPRPKSRSTATAAAAASPAPPPAVLPAPQARPAITRAPQQTLAAAASGPQPAQPITSSTARPMAPAPMPPTAAPATNAMPLAAGSATFAVSSRLLRTRAEAEQVRDAMQGLLRVGAIGGDAAAGAQATAETGRGGAAAGLPVQVEVLPQGDDFRVVGWPFGQRAQAEKARTVLISRGMRVEVVSF